MAEKKVTKVYLTYKGGSTGADDITDGTGVVPKFAVDGGSFTGGFNSDESGGNGTHLIELPYSAGWITKKLYPRDSTSNIRSFAFALQSVSNSDPAHHNFEVNDITIIYRTKNVK
jgi:hypothetical protein